MDIEIKQLIAQRVEMKDQGQSDPGLMRMYFSTWDNWDDVRPVPERPVKGAFLESFPEFLKSGFYAQGHDHDGLPYGMPMDAGEDSYGAWVEIQFHSTPEAQKARTVFRERVSAGKDVKVSMGYRVLDDEIVPIENEGLKAAGFEKGRLLKRIDLKEVSTVNIPANHAAGVTAVKGGSLAGLTMEDHSEAVLATGQGYVTRCKGLQELRAKENRVFAGVHMARMKAVRQSMGDCCDMMDQMIAAGEPPQKAAPENDETMLQEIMAFELAEARSLIYGASTR